MRVSVSYIRIITLLYIAFSLFPFFLGWTRLYYGIPLSLLLGLGIYQFTQSLSFDEVEFYSKRQLVIAIVILFLWVSFSGAGGMGYQVTDLYKSNTLVKELSTRSWPLEYDVDGEKMYLSHYLAYYIAAPTVFSILGFKVTQLALFVYTFIGILISVFWLHRFIKGNLAFFSVFFILFGGIATFSFVNTFGSESLSVYLDKILNHGYLFWLNSREVIPLNFMSVTDMLYWTPQHAIPAFLGVGIMLNAGFVDGDIKYMPFIICLLAMWSPMVLVGLFPLFVFVLLLRRFEGIWNYVNLIIAPILFIVLASFLLAIESGELVQHFIFTDLTGQGVSILKQMGIYFHFLFFEVVIWAIPIYAVLKNGFAKDEKILFLFTCVMLMIIPLYRFGLWNDWCTRVSMGSLIVLSLFAFRALVNAKGILKGVMILLFISGAQAASIGIIGSVIYSDFRPNFKSPEESQVLTLPEICVGYPITQFVASEDTFFFKHLAKQKMEK